MKRCMRHILIVLLLSLSGLELAAQNFTFDSAYVSSVRDSVARYYRKHPWKKPKNDSTSKVQVIPLYAVGYSPEKQAAAMGGFMMNYPVFEDETLPLSNIGLMASISTNLSISASLSGLNYAAKGRLFTSYSLKYYRNPWSFWGLGYDSASDDANKSTFLENRIKARADIIGLFASGRLRTGIFLGYDYYRAENFSRPTLIESGPTASDYLIAGLRLDFDTRDAVSDPSRGVFLRLEPSFNIATTSRTSDFYRIEFIADFYFSLWRGAVLALDLYADLSSDSAPWTMWNETGGDVRMRGYYTGRYRDRNFVSIQAELRQNIYKQHGIALWGGAGNVFPSFSGFDIDHILPTYGLGYRFTIWNVTLRIDAGFGRKGQYGIYAGINQAF